MKINDIITGASNTSVTMFSKKSWAKEENFIIIMMKFNGDVYPHFMLQKKGKIIGKFDATATDLLSDDFFKMEPSIKVQANFFKRFYIYQKALEIQVKVIAKATNSPVPDVTDKDVPSHAVKEVKVVKTKKPYKSKGKKGSPYDPNRECLHDKHTKFTTGVIGMSVHCAFGPTSKEDKISSDKITVRARYAKSLRIPNGVQEKNYEFNDIGLINGRHYLDSEIRREGLNSRLWFKDADYKFISKYGIKTWISVTSYKSKFDWEGTANILANRYLTVPKEHAIPESYPARVIIDYSILIDVRRIPKEDLVGLKYA